MSTEGVFLKYRDVPFRKDRLELLGVANKILDEFGAKGYALTLRQLHYQFVARDIYPNTQASYNMLGRLISDGREAGLVSWTSIEDRGRNLMGMEYQISPKEALKKLRDNYKKNLWENQPCRVEVWVEKQALEGVIGRICNELRVNFFATKGYNSQSEQWRAGRRFANYIQHGQRPIVLHLGDHDPSGIDMTRDNRDRLELFTGVPVQVTRLALNMEQVERLRPPPNPARDTDSRFEDYRKKFGDESWELDALNPEFIHDLIRKAVNDFRDPVLWAEAEAQEAEDLDDLDIMIEEMQ